MNNPFEFSVYIAGLAAITLVVDYMMRGKFRQDFAFGVAVIAAALIAFVCFGSAHHGHHTKADRIIGLGLLIMVLLGSVIFDDANIRAQERGEMSKWGDAIELWGNNYWSNLRDRYKTWVGIGILCFVLVGAIFEKEVQPAKADVTVAAHHTAAPVLAKVAQSGQQKMHAAAGKYTPHSSAHSSSHSTKHSSNQSSNHLTSRSRKHSQN